MPQVVKKNGFLSRFFSSIGAVFMGIILVVACTVGLAWNEGRGVKAIRAIDDVEKVMIDVGSAQVKSENEGKLVGISGNVTFTTSASDSLYGLTANSFVLIRIVEVYQWKETKSGSSSDSSVTYSYDKVWTQANISSSSFYDKTYTNPAWPTDAAYASSEFYSDDAKLGDFNLTTAQMKQLPATANVQIPDDITIVKPDCRNITADKKYLTNVTNLSDPLVGEIRISFIYSDITQASALGKQQGSNISTYTTKNGTDVNRILAGIKTGPEMVEYLRNENTAVTWALRLLFTLLICCGFAMLLTPVKVIVSLVPFLGKFLGKATKTVAGVIGAILGLALSLLVIAIAWILVRPLIGIPLLVVVALLIFLLVRRSKVKKQEKSTPA